MYNEFAFAFYFLSYLEGNQITMIPNDFAQGLTALRHMYVGLRQRLNGVGFEDKKRCRSLNKFVPYITNLLYLLFP